MKNLEYYKKQVRKKFPSYTEAQVAAAAQSAYESDPESTYKKPKTQTSGAKTKPTFDTGTEEDDGVTGITIGFGTDASLVPVKIESYVVSLLKKNPKAYASIKRSIETVTGRKYNDPNLVGAYVARLAENIYQSDDAAAKQVSVEDYLRLAAQYRTSGAGKPKPDLSRSVYQYTPEQIGADVDKIAQEVLGRSINEADKAASWYTDLTKAISKMAAKGTVSQVKDVRNPVTGKLERITTQVPEFSKEAAAAKIESTLKNVSPEDVERKERSDFMSWMIGQIGGGR